jgi:pimeloyl-ACP methyl ester carboxylesterase
MMAIWLGRAGLTFLALLVLSSPFAYASFTSWRNELKRELIKNSTVVMTARGPVEYAQIGHGSPVLMFHGSPSGYDGTLNYLEATRAELKFRYISPSRPGYLRTPLSVGRTPKEQADAFAALLDVLGIKRVAVIATSGGGPSGLQFALNYPDRCSALVLQEAVTAKQTKFPFSSTPFIYDDWLSWLEREFGGWYWRVRAPHDPDQAAIALSFLDSIAPRAQREAGRLNDAEQFALIGDWPLDRIRCPTLIVHGAADQNVPLAGPVRAHALIANSELVVLPNEGHMMLITRHTEVDALISAFLVKHTEVEDRTSADAR